MRRNMMRGLCVAVNRQQTAAAPNDYCYEKDSKLYLTER